MKKLLISFIALFAAVGVCFAATTAKNLQMVFKGPWESTPSYATKKVFNSANTYTAPVVTDAGHTFISNGESVPAINVHPTASGTTGWSQIS